MELKTLKDLFVGEIKEWKEKSFADHGNTKSKWVTRKLWDSDDCGYTWSISSVEEELRKEAIKWINKLEDINNKFMDRKLPVDTQLKRNAQIEWIKFFFNIKEEDLK